MNILFFIGTLGGGGAERVLTTLAATLAKRGHNVTISVNKSIQTYEVDKKINLVFAKSDTKKTQGNGLLRRLRQAKNFLDYIPYVKKTIANSKPDVIVSFMHCNLIPIILFHKKIPVVSSEHAAMDNPRNSYIGRFWLNRFVNQVAVLTPYDKGYATAKGIRNITIMPNPLTWDPIDEKSFDESFDGRKNILACGRIDAWKVKGFDLLIQAFSMIAHKYPDWRIDIAGKGSDDSIAHLKKMAEDNGIGDRVCFMGFQQDVQSVMKAHSIFVLSSRTEGFPMVLTEAMSVGTASVCYERLANSIINEGIDGVLVENQNIPKLANAIELLIKDRDYRFEVGRNAIRNISRFSIDNVALKWECLFESLTRHRQGST